MPNFNDKLQTLLKTDTRFVDQEGDLLRNEVIDKAFKIDEKLMGLLIADEETKSKFFSEIKKCRVFNINKFIDYIQDKNFLNDSYTKYKNKIGLNVGNRFLKERNEVSLVRPYKDCILEGGQNKKDQKRKEIFFNEILAQDEIDRLLDPKILTNWKRYSKEGEKPIKEISRYTDGTIKENLIIKGNNLLALHSLKKEFKGKVRLIYIDPPYNTGDDGFNYNDNFNHSTWLTFMKNRLEIAKELLKDDGVLIVSCDDNEQAYLKILLDEIMGQEQFEVSFYVQVRYGNKTLAEDNDFQKVMEIAHIYSKKHGVFLPNKIKEEYTLEKFCFAIKELGKGEIVEVNGKKVEIFKEGQYVIEKVPSDIDALKETWATGSLIRQGGTAAEFLSKYLIKRKDTDGLKVLYKVYGMGEDGLGYRYISGPQKESAFRGKFYTGIPLKIKEAVRTGDYSKEKSIPNLLYNFLEYQADFGNCRHEGGVDIGGGKKPEVLILNLIEYFTNPNDIILDYHLGSGTTCAVAHKIGRQYIGIEQLNYGENDSMVRLQNVINGDQSGISPSIERKGGGNFIYCELKKYNQDFIDQIQEAKDTKGLLKIWDDMKSKSFLNYNVDITKQDESIEEFKQLSLVQQKQILVELLDKNQLYVNLSEINDKNFEVSKEDKVLNKMFYGL